MLACHDGERNTAREVEDSEVVNVQQWSVKTRKMLLIL